MITAKTKKIKATAKGVQLHAKKTPPSRSEPRSASDISTKEGVSVIEYSKLRYLFAVEIAKLTLSHKDEAIMDCIKTSALLLDIGKCCNQLKKQSSANGKKDKYLYNEIGWAFLSKYLPNKNPKAYEFILDCVYWSNGIATNRNKKMNGYTNNNVMDTIDISDKGAMTVFLKEIITLTNDGLSYADIKVDAPAYYSKSDSIANAKKTFIRTCVISAEKLISALNINRLKELIHNTDLSLIGRMIDDLTKRNYYNDSLSYDNYDEKRINIQLGIVKNCEKTTIVNAPSGFGKSLIGVLWNLISSKKKLIWVCPRNAVAQSAYINILKELKSLNIHNNISVELYLTGNVQKTNTERAENYSGFSSDIIVTNIDNFLNPSINTNNSDRLFFINNCDVVFDEYHELIGEEALFACFVNIMNTRNRFTNSQTLLLSATPLKINNLWDNGINLRTKILPNNHSHYPAAHKKKYQFYTHELQSLQTFKVKQNTSSIVVLNSIANSQIIHNQIGSGKLTHSNFCQADKDKIFEHIYNKFDKTSSRFLSKDNVTGTHVIQASLDISFLNLFESVLSPLSTLQRIGRCDRWGDYANTAKISSYKIDDRAENKMKEILYTKSLSDKWFQFISKHDGKTLALDRLYELYNEFNKINTVEVNKFIENCHDKSLQNFVKIYPKYFKSIKTDRIMRAGANKLRSNGSDIFFICKVHNSDKYSDVIADSNYAYFKGYGEDEKTLGRIIKAMKSIRAIKDNRYNYNGLIDEWDINVIREGAKDSDTPYIRFDVVYHPEYGVIKKSVLNQIIN